MGYKEEKAVSGSKEGVSSIPVFACMAMIVVYVGRVQEIVPQLRGLPLALVTTVLVFILSVLDGRLNFSVLWRTTEAKLVLLFLFLGLVSVPLSVWPGGAFRIWRTVFVSNALFFFCCYANAERREDLFRLLWGLTLGITFLLLGVFLRHGFGEFGERVAVTMSYDPNDLAMWIVCSLPLVAVLTPNYLNVKGVFLGILSVLMLFVLLHTGSRGGIFSLLACGGLFFVIRTPGFGAIRKLLVLGALVIAIIVLVPQSLVQRFQNLWKGTDYNITAQLRDGTEGRITIWRHGMQLLGENMLSGVGAGQAGNAMGPAYGQYAWRTVHNAYLQAGLEIGLGGGVVFLVILLKIWINTNPGGYQKNESGQERQTVVLANSVRIALVGYAVSCLFISQAYSSIVPFLLACSGRLAAAAHGEQPAVQSNNSAKL